MKNLAISILSLFVLTQCHEAELDRSSTQLLIGSWKNVANDNTIEFDENHRYSVKFRTDTAFSCSYRLQSSEKSNRLLIYDAKVTHEYEYQFLGEDQLQLTQVFPAGYHVEKHVGIFQRLK